MIRNTRQREVLVRVIREADRPLSPQEIFELALVYYPKLGLRTVYRHIKDLVSSHSIAGIDYPGQPMRYEVVDHRGSRPHFICRRCQKVFDLPIEEPQVLYPVLDDFCIEGHEVVFFGSCRECRNQTAHSSGSTTDGDPS
jgi:Fur family ferric uptake transcriptional regulator